MFLVQGMFTNNKTHAFFALCVLLGLSGPMLAGPRDGQNNNRDNQNNNTDEIVSQPTEGDQEGAAQQPLDSISQEDRIRLRRDLDEYSRSVDTAHVQIEERRRIMRQRIQERFFGSDKDNDGSISREEAFETLPQIARHFSQVDLNGDGVITLNELEAAQARAIERQRAATARNEVQELEQSPKRKSKEVASNRKRAL